MDDTILGLHHITAIAGSAQKNHEFYTRVLGQRLVKKTVNFDDPGTYHFYYGNESGYPGTILTFFPWEGIGHGFNGSGMATNISFVVPAGSLEFWQERFKKYNVAHSNPTAYFGETSLPFQDPDGLQLTLVTPAITDTRSGWVTDEVGADAATNGFHSVALTVRDIGPTAKILTDIFGYSLQQQEGDTYRFVTNAVANAGLVDIVEDAAERPGRSAAGTNHHVAFRVKDDNVLMAFREKIAAKGFGITPKIDRDYFYSLYFREPGGILFEIATDNPGFTKDESLEELGKTLKLPRQYENNRAEIEKMLPSLEAK